MDVANLSIPKLFNKIQENSLLIFLSISINICALALPIYTLQVYDRIITSQNFSTFFILAGGAFVFILLEFIFRLLRNNLISFYANNNKHGEFLKAINQFARIKPEQLFTRSLAEKSDIINELSKTHDFIYRQLYVALVDILFLFLFLIVITLLSPKLSLVIVLVLAVFTALAIQINLSIIKKHKNRERSDEKRLSGIIHFLRSVFVAKIYSNDFFLLQQHDIIERKSVINTYKLAIIMSSLYNFSIFTTQILIVATLFIGVSQVNLGYLTFGTLIATIIIVGRLTNPIREMLTIWFRISTFLTSNNRIADFYKENTRIYLKGNLSTKFNHILDINNVSVKEGHKSNKFAFTSLNIKLKTGECAAITSINTHQRFLLKRLLTGAISPEIGDILVLGNPLYQLNSEQFYSSVGYITIDEHYINGTLLENITGGRDIADEEIEELCQIFSIKNEIAHLEHGFQTPINGNTLHELSLNLRIKILLVRAYIYRPKLVIIDTDDEYVDEELYQTLFKFLKKIRSNTAILIISNDYNLTMIADYYYKADECRYHDFEINRI